MDGDLPEAYASFKGGWEDITLKTILNPADPKTRKAKICCSIGPSSSSVESIQTLIDGGMTVARIHSKYYENLEGAKQIVSNIRAASLAKSRVNIGVIWDLTGPELLTGSFADDREFISLTRGENVTITANVHYKGDKSKFAINFPELPDKVKAKDEIIIDDGNIVLVVLYTNPTDGEVTCRVLTTDNIIGPNMVVNIPSIYNDLPALTSEDIVKIGMAVEVGVDFVTSPFCRSPDDIREIQSHLGEKGQGIKIIAKITNSLSCSNFPQILRAADAVMFRSAELGREFKNEMVFKAQKYIIRECNIAGIPVMVGCEHVLMSDCKRRDCSNIAAAIYDGVDCMMIGGATAMGPHPGEAVSIMARVIVEAEHSLNYHTIYRATRNTTLNRFGVLPPAESLAHTAVKTCYDVKAKLIIVFSESGKQARYVAKFRPTVPVICITPYKSVSRQVFSICRGCVSVMVPNLEDTQKLITDTVYEALMMGLVKDGDPYVVCAGKTFWKGAAANQVRCAVVEYNYWDDGDSSQHQSSARLLGSDQSTGCSIM